MGPVVPQHGGDDLQGVILPRGLSCVGFLRHAPPQVLEHRLHVLLRRRPPADSDWVEHGSRSRLASQKLPPSSPYIGFRRHAPPSPSFSCEPNFPRAFSKLPDLVLSPDAEAAASDAAPSAISFGSGASRRPAFLGVACAQFSWKFPEEVWATIFAAAVDVRDIGRVSRLARGFPELIASEATWRGRPVRISPQAALGLSQRLDIWVRSWRCASKLVVPNSPALLVEIERLAPELPVEISWRFDRLLRGSGVEVLRAGAAVRRISCEEAQFVVLGDAPLASGPSRQPYLEVRLDERGAAVAGADGLNDFGMGFTVCRPGELELEELGVVADEVPHSWVVDFTQSFVALSVNDHEAASGSGVSAAMLKEGDCVGLRVTRGGGVEVFINGTLRERLEPKEVEDRIPVGEALHPVLDLYGRTVQLSCTENEGPCSFV